MTIKTDNKGKHLTIHDRTFIEDALNIGYTLSEIAYRLKKDPTTISKEIKRNRLFKESRTEFQGGCINRSKCTKKHLCNTSCKDLCKKCTTLNCLRHCPDFQIKSCKIINTFPHVCNSCETKTICKLHKYRYSAKHADAGYRDKLETTREGINMSKNQLQALDDLIAPLMQKGQPISHIYANHKDEIMCSERTLYHYIDMNLLSVRNIDLRRKVKYKPRKKESNTTRKSTHRLNRSYDDFTAYMLENPDTEVVEMDTVIGKKGGKVLLTLFFRRSSLMLAFLLDSCTQDCTIEAIDRIYDAIGMDVFKSNFALLLTDNGSEFLNPEAIENDLNGNQRTKVFFCDPMSSYQKGQLEKNHEFIRYVLPKGKSFDFLTQEKVTLLINHINSVSRKKLNNKTPFELAQLLQNSVLLDALSLKNIHPDDVCLNEELVDPTKIKKLLSDVLK